ncbi:hypothetical protein F4678DRAFT_446122 [Xylaria arbuscula]|nr:hypothetical protein F4678DRAFT_446122 [Xylaria arbuscula]
MSRKDADINLFCLSSQGVIYLERSGDEWYRISPKPILTNQNGYLPIEPAFPLGCTEQYQFCHGDTQHFGPLASLSDATDGTASLLNNTIDSFGVIDDGTACTGLLKYVLTAFGGSKCFGFGSASKILGAASLTSRKIVENTHGSTPASVPSYSLC